MKLIQWQPRMNMLNAFDEFDRIIDNVFHHSIEKNASISYKPLMNVNETNTEYKVSMDLPGIKKNDIEVNVSDGVLTISGERKLNKDYQDSNYIWQEANYGSFKRSFELDHMIQEDKIKAQFKDGVLSLTVPKVEEVKPISKNIAIS